MYFENTKGTAERESFRGLFVTIELFTVLKIVRNFTKEDFHHFLDHPTINFVSEAQPE